jgi:hypothetical protein
MSVTSTLTIPQRIALAKRLGIDDPADMTSERLVEEPRADRPRPRSRVRRPKRRPDRRALGRRAHLTPRTKTTAADALIDGAIGRGAIASSERASEIARPARRRAAGGRTAP